MTMPAGADSAKVEIGQWQPDINFGQFAELTMRKYYPRAVAANGKH